MRATEDIYARLFACVVTSSPHVIVACSNLTRMGIPAASGAPARAARNDAHPQLAQVVISSDSCCTLAVDSNLNRIYVSRTADPYGSNTTVIDGSALVAVTTIAGFGGAHNVDTATRNFWLPGLYAGNVEVFSGRTDGGVATVNLSACPTDSWIDATRRYAWISAQCGSGNDPVWAVDADKYKKVSGRIGTGGVMGATVVNPVTGKFYVNNTSGSYEIAPGSFTISPTSFGIAYAVNARTNLIYATTDHNSLNIVDGNNDQVLQNVPLSYPAGVIAVNQRLNHVYLASGSTSNFIDVRDGTTGNLVTTITLPAGTAVVSLAADNRRRRIYAGGASGSTNYLYKITDRY
jgi:hypothetical protein